MKIRPLHDRVVVRRMEEETTTPGGIVLPGNAQEKPQQGEVIAVGEGRYVDGQLRPLSVKTGDKVVFGSFAGNTVKVDGEELLIMTENEIFGVLEG
ncbi:co-chaperone GroES [Terasakiispira papahanaumokuakeensis]|uniref:Co-chaperonin GroES n=1 Tax=Terasakiispira papahanaumokuakeensis TaxID=197479 RepID=A0A1E2VA93_9GAMM|nr:co-chaperone GroES [Terasakiispira papahanaumokuakeensis]ODC03782.1 co-chaperone GroES [Terasakiispira papahanaumokuakeensis]